MITLSDISALQITAYLAYKEALEEVRALAMAHEGGPEAVARLDGAERELEILRKLEVELLANGKATSLTLPKKRTEIDSGALLQTASQCPAKIAESDSRGTAGAKDSAPDQKPELILQPVDDEGWIDQPANHAARLDGPGMFELPAATCGPAFW